MLVTPRSSTRTIVCARVCREMSRRHLARGGGDRVRVRCSNRDVSVSAAEDRQRFLLDSDERTSQKTAPRWRQLNPPPCEQDWQT